MFGQLNARELDFESCPVPPSVTGQLLDLIESGMVSGLRAKDILTVLLDNSVTKSPEDIAKSRGWIQDQNRTAIETLCKKVISDNPDVVNTARHLTR